LIPPEAVEAIQRILARTDSLSFTAHARQRARERRFDADDVHNVLTRGTVSPNPQWSDQFGNWTYLVKGHDLDNERLAVVIALEPDLDRITIITGEDW
jgi:hypothetical protein